MQINACRRFLQAQSLADITNMTGTRLLSFAMSGTGPVPAAHIKVSRFNQPHPGSKSWRTWRRFLSTISNTYGVLQQPLQQWTQPVHKTRHWPTYAYDPSTDTLMSYQGSSRYQLHSRVSPGCFSIRPTSTTIPASGYPTAVTVTMDTLRPEYNYIPQAAAPSTEISIGLDQNRSVAAWENALLGQCQGLKSPAVIHHAITNSQLITCSDGSVRNSHGSFGFIISDIHGTRLLQGFGPAPGNPPTSFRSEAYGVLATVRWLHRAYQLYKPANPPPVTHYLDNQSVIRRINNSMKSSWQSPNCRLLPEQDVIDEIIVSLRQLPFPVNLEWIQGHQDSRFPFSSLSLPAQMNCEADRAASKWHSPLYTTETPVLPLPTTPSRLIINGCIITGYAKRRVYEAATIPHLHIYLRRKFRWTETTLTHIDWPIYQQILQVFRDRWTTLVKHLHGISPTGKYAHRNNHLLPHECPTCSMPFESNNHVMECPHPSRMPWRDATIRKTTRYRQESVDPHLLDILRDGLTRFHRQLEPPQPAAYPPHYSTVIEQQNCIGWDHLYRGRWSENWKIQQDKYQESHPHLPSLSGSDWTKGVGRILLDQWFQLWTIRNEDRHGKDQTRHSILREGTLHAELRELYTYRTLVCPIDRHIFHPTADNHIQQHPSLDALEDWLRSYRPVIMASADQAKKLGITRTNTILAYSANNPITTPTEQASLPAGLFTG